MSPLPERAESKSAKTLLSQNLQSANQGLRRLADAKKVLQILVTSVFTTKYLTAGRRSCATPCQYWKEEWKKTL